MNDKYLVMLAWICMESINANVLYLSSIDRIGCLRFRFSLSNVAGCVVHSVLCMLVYMSSAVSSLHVLLKQRWVLPRVQDIIRPSTPLLSRPRIASSPILPQIPDLGIIELIAFSSPSWPTCALFSFSQRRVQTRYRAMCPTTGNY